MDILTGSRSRYERRSLARQRRIQRRLDQVQSVHQQRPAAHAGRRWLVSTAARAGIFCLALLLGLGLARAAGTALLGWWNDEPVTLRSVAVQGARRLSGEEVARTVADSRGAPLETLSLDAIEASVRAHPWIRDARAALLPTGTLIVDVEEREPRAVLRRGEGDEAHWRFVDEDGVAFAPVDPSRADEAARMPALAASAEQPEDGMQAALSDALPLLARLDAMELPGLADDGRPHRGLALRLPGADADRGWVLVREDGGTEVILGGDASAVLERLDRLERLLSAGLEELDHTRSIDLRFAGQAVLRTEGASS